MCETTRVPSVDSMSSPADPVLAPPPGSIRAASSTSSATALDAPAASPPGGRVNWTAVVAFVAIACGLPWLVEMPVWAGDGLADPLFLPLTVVMMYTPALAAVIVTFWLIEPAHPGRFLGLTPVRPLGRFLRYSALALVAPPVLAAVAALLGAAAGLVTLGTSPAQLATLVTLPLFGLLVAVAAFGEELGWRGFLLPALRPLGTVPSLLVNGVVWGLWHAPLILLGYNYGQPNVLGLALMVGFTTLVGVLLGWLRMRSESVWTCAIAHGSINAAAGLVLLAVITGPQDLDASLLGWAGWVVLAVVIGVVATVSSFRWADSPLVRRSADREVVTSR